MFSNIRSLIFKLDHETAHNLAIKSLKFNFVPNISIENMRAEKSIGSSLEAMIEIKLNKEFYNKAKNINFSEICITSSASI